MSSSAGFGFTPFGRKILNVQLEVLDHLVVALDLTLQPWHRVRGAWAWHWYA